MKVLFCTAEVQPFSKVGGMAEFSNAIPSTLHQAGLDVSIITPFYSSVNQSVQPITPFERYPGIDIKLENESFNVEYFQSSLPDSNVPVYLVKCDPFFGRDGIYTNPAKGVGFIDNHRRFALFQEAILHLIQVGVFSPDLLHLNDHHTALIPAMLKSRKDHVEAFNHIKTLLTLHNVSFQIDSEESFAWTLGLSHKLFEPDGPYRRNNRLNFLKAGVVLADKVVTVSQAYADETRSNDDSGYGLSQELSRRGEDYFGILNGVDYSQWDPKNDEMIKQTFSIRKQEHKLANKKELLAKNGLDHSNLDIPCIGMITRLTDNKGFDLLASAFEKLMTFDLSLVMLGTGEARYHKLFESIKMRYPHKFGLNLTYSNQMAHNIMAGADFFLMPSRYEPCGQHQMFAMRYGAVPIVHATGGLADTVRNATDDGSDGWGFTFTGYDPTLMLKTVWRAVSMFKDKKRFKKIVSRAMEQDFSWLTTAEQYKKVYESLVD